MNTLFPQAHFGCNLEPQDARDFLYERIAGTTPTFPTEFLVDVPYHFYQNGLDSCVGSSVAAAKSVQEKKEISPRDIWSRAKELEGYRGWGTYISKALKGLQTFGACDYGLIEESVSLNREEYMKPNRTDNVISSALENRSLSYWGAYTTDWATIDNALMTEKIPLVTSMMWYESYNKPNKGVLPHPDYPVYGHAFVYIGWKKINGVKVRVFKNSWQIEWGDEGNFYIEDSKKDQYRLGTFFVITDIPRTKAEILNEYQGKLIRNPGKPEHYYVGKRKIAHIKNEESFTFGRDNGYWGDWSDTISITDPIEADLTF